MAGGRLQNDNDFWFFFQDSEDDSERLLQIIQLPRKNDIRRTRQNRLVRMHSCQFQNDNSIRVNLLTHKVNTK